MNTKWYVEHFDAYEERGGLRDFSEPFDTEDAARLYAETLAEDYTTLYKVENNLFVEVDAYSDCDTDIAPAGWFSAFTQAELDEHVAKVAEQKAERLKENAQRWDDTLRQLARAQAGDKSVGAYALAGTTYPLSSEDEAKIAAYRAEYEAEKVSSE